MRGDDGQPPTPGQALCLGAFETFHWFSSIGELQGNARFGIPPDNTTQDVIQAFVDFALKHRDLLDKRAQFVWHFLSDVSQLKVRSQSSGWFANRRSISPKQPCNSLSYAIP